MPPVRLGAGHRGGRKQKPRGFTMAENPSAARAEAAMREGDPAEGLAALEEAVRRNPSDSRLRVFLFQVLSVLGDWDRALVQLNVVGELDSNAMPMVYTYQTALRSEALRADVFRGARSPLVLGEPEHWMGLLMEALRLTADQRYEESQALRNEAFAAAPASSGSIDGQPFEWLADMDTRLGPMLEAVVNGRYYWVPFHRIRALHLEQPADLRDLVWMPASFIWTNGGEAVGLIPTRYPDSESHPDNGIRMARRTEWAMPVEDLYLGQGQRMLGTDSGEYPIMDVRHLEITPPAEG